MEGRGLLVITVVLMVAVGALGFGYLRLNSALAAASFDVKRATLLVDKLEKQVATFDSKLGDTESRVRSQMVTSATQAATDEATKAALASVESQLAGFAKLGKPQSWTADQAFQLGSTSVEITRAPGGGTAVEWLNQQGIARNRIAVGTVQFGDEVVIHRPEGWAAVRKTITQPVMLLVASDVGAAADEQTPVVAIRDHETTEGILLLGLKGTKQTTADIADITPDDWRFALDLESLLFGPPGAPNTSLLDAGILRDKVGNLVLRGQGTDVATVGPDSFTVKGAVILNNTRSTAGDPPGAEGMIYINTADNAIRMYAEGGWRTLASW